MRTYPGCPQIQALRDMTLGQLLRRDDLPDWALVEASMTTWDNHLRFCRVCWSPPMPRRYCLVGAALNVYREPCWLVRGMVVVW